jgi:5-methylcytosine-specific restriction endonuclease McrA
VVFHDNAKKYRDNNKEKKYEYDIKYRNSYALYDTYNKQLTIDDEPLLSDDGKTLHVRCRYCGKHFKPTNREVYGRLNSLKGKISGDCYFYCSTDCKTLCSTYGQHRYPKDFDDGVSRYDQPELRQMVFERDDYTCQKCGVRGSELNCHHIDPVKSNPIESADVDNCITLCKGCHKVVHQQDGCTLKELRGC